MLPINAPISLLAPLTGTNLAPAKQPGGSEIGQPPQTAFSQFLENAIDKLDQTQKKADQATMEMITGQAPDLHNAILALEKANLSFSLAVEVRNKVLDAYHEIIRMQI